jgi:hypothetical protein
MNDREKIAALCDAVRVLWWDGVGGVLDPNLVAGISHLLKTCEESRRERGQYPTDEESVDI